MGFEAWLCRGGLECIVASRRKTSAQEISRATQAAAKLLRAGHSVIVHSTKSGSNPSTAAKLKGAPRKSLGTALETFCAVRWSKLPFAASASLAGTPLVTRLGRWELKHWR